MKTTLFTSKFSEEIWHQTYKFHTDDVVSSSHRRIADDLASDEKNPKEWADKFYDALTDFKVVPGGRINSNAGTNLHGTTYINCFVDAPVGDDIDSIKGIFNGLTRAALTLKSEGGYGFCSDFIRPRGSFIYGVGVETPGAVEMLRLWDLMSDVITKGSGKKKQKKEGKNKIRKGAMMVTMSCWHPDIEEFITIKSTDGNLSKFNMSVLCTSEFMNAVKNDLDWNLIYPDTTNENYKKLWDGNITAWKEAGLPVTIHKTLKATELWELIMRSTYNRNEPGVLFSDRMNELNNLKYCEFISCTNPCGEQILPKFGVCLLGSLNLTQFINGGFTDWDYKKLAKYIPIFVRMLDNVNDKTNVPLPEQKESLLNKRRIGMGYLGYGSALYMLRARYGSGKAIKLTESLAKFVTNEAYKASAKLAAEKGAFPLYDADKYMASKFIAQALDEDTKKLIRKHGIRNSHLTSIQPTGNSAIYANNVSGGLEPVVSPSYWRTSIVPVAPDGLVVPKVSWSSKSLEGNGNDWKWTKEGDEDILATKFENTIYKIDRNRGLTKETLVEDYAVGILRSKNQWQPEADWAADIYKLNIKEHVDTMKTFAKYIDSAMSKTINIPNDYPYEDFKSLYMDMFDSGVIKGGTSYRHGTMTSVVSSTKTEIDSSGRPASIEMSHAPKRPVELPCDIHASNIKGEKWVVLVGKLKDRPYELFAGKAENLELPSKIKSGKIVKVKQGVYSLHLGEGEDELIVKNILKVFDNQEMAWATRMISLTLRHGVIPSMVVAQLEKGSDMGGINKVLSRILKKYIPDGQEVGTNVACPSCNGKKLIYMEGCMLCKDCSYSKCI